MKMTSTNVTNQIFLHLSVGTCSFCVRSWFGDILYLRSQSQLRKPSNNSRFSTPEITEKHIEISTGTRFLIIAFFLNSIMIIKSSRSIIVNNTKHSCSSHSSYNGRNAIRYVPQCVNKWSCSYSPIDSR